MKPWGRGRRLIVLAAGAVVSTIALVVLGNWFPVSLPILTAWAAIFFLDGGLPASPWRPQPWLYATGFTLVFSGLGLLIGAASGYPPREHVTVGVVLGIVLFVLGTVIAVVGQRRFTARVIDEEIERHRQVE